MSIKKLNEELESLLEDQLYEMATIIKTQKVYISADADSNRNWFNEEYFKIYNKPNFRVATALARIKFRSPEYVYHNTPGKKNWKLTNNDKNDLINIFKQSSKKEPNLTNWQYAIIQFNLEAYEDAGFTYCMQLTQDKQNKIEDNDPRKKWLPIDLPMPDYNKL